MAVTRLRGDEATSLLTGDAAYPQEAMRAAGWTARRWI